MDEAEAFENVRFPTALLDSRPLNHPVHDPEQNSTSRGICSLVPGSHYLPQSSDVVPPFLPLLERKKEKEERARDEYVREFRQGSFRENNLVKFEGKVRV